MNRFGVTGKFLLSITFAITVILTTSGLITVFKNRMGMEQQAQSRV